MYREEIKRFEQDGFEIVAYITPDEDMQFGDHDEEPNENDTPEFTSYYETRREQFEHGLWCFVGVIVEANLKLEDGTTIQLGSDSLWGLESDDIDYRDESVIPELATEAIIHAERRIEEIKTAR